MSKPGREFEKAVFTFVEALDPTAEVIFDHRVFDKDTGALRQCDVWINAKFGGHLPLSILVSCKDHSRKLNVGDIGTFCDEVRSTGASTGVIYSRSGFSKNAIVKARSNGIACCKLYQNEPPDIPGSVWFDHFACYLSMNIKLASNLDNEKYSIWDDLFDIRVSDGDATILDVLSQVFLDEGGKIVDKYKEETSLASRQFPRDWANEIIFDLDDFDGLRIQVFGLWRWYRARTEASLLKGSYCITDNSFKGEMLGPAIHVRGSHPGEQWEQIADRDFILPNNAILAVLFPPAEVKEQFREGFGLKSIVNKENAG